MALLHVERLGVRCAQFRPLGGDAPVHGEDPLIDAMSARMQVALTLRVVEAQQLAFPLRRVLVEYREYGRGHGDRLGIAGQEQFRSAGKDRQSALRQISSAGDRAYVTARSSDALLVFDTVSAAPTARIATVPVGSAPVGVIVVQDGRRIIVTNSNRFSADADNPSTLALVDAGKVGEGAAAVIRTLAAGAFPRELHLMADGRTLMLTNFRSQTVRVIDTSRLPER